MFVEPYPYAVPAESRDRDDEEDLNLSPAAVEDFDPSGYWERLSAKQKRASQFVLRHGRLVRRKDKTVHDPRWKAEKGDKVVKFDPIDARDWQLHGLQMRTTADANYVAFLVKDGIVEYNRMVVEEMMGDLAAPDAGKDVDKTSNVAVSD